MLPSSPPQTTSTSCELRSRPTASSASATLPCSDLPLLTPLSTLSSPTRTSRPTIAAVEKGRREPLPLRLGSSLSSPRRSPLSHPRWAPLLQLRRSSSLPRQSRPYPSESDTGAAIECLRPALLPRPLQLARAEQRRRTALRLRRRSGWTRAKQTSSRQLPLSLTKLHRPLTTTTMTTTMTTTRSTSTTTSPSTRQTAHSSSAAASPLVPPSSSPRPPSQCRQRLGPRQSSTARLGSDVEFRTLRSRTSTASQREGEEWQELRLRLQLRVRLG